MTPRTRFARALGPLRGPACPAGPRRPPTLLGERAFGASLVERMSRAFALVLVGVVACGGDDGGDGGGSTPAHEHCVSETNRYRAMDGKPAVAYSPELEDYANEGARVDFSSSPHNHFTSTSGGGIAFAENECPQQGNWQLPPGGDMSELVGQCIAAFYSEGAGGGHYENLMGPYKTVGCGIYESGGRVTIVQDFGN